MSADRLPHVLHLTIGKDGWLAWKLDCPYSATEVDDRPGRPCKLVTENRNPLTYDAHPWTPIPGCFATEWLSEAGFEDVVHLGVTDPVFPLLVDVESDGWGEDSEARIIPWEADDAR